MPEVSAFCVSGDCPSHGHSCVADSAELPVRGDLEAYVFISIVIDVLTESREENVMQGKLLHTWIQGPAKNSAQNDSV
jgi:hypothetical protein